MGVATMTTIALSNRSGISGSRPRDGRAGIGVARGEGRSSAASAVASWLWEVGLPIVVVATYLVSLACIVMGVGEERAWTLFLLCFSLVVVALILVVPILRHRALFAREGNGVA